MVEASPTAAPAAVSLLRLGKLGVVGAGLSGVYLLTGLGLPCPFRAITGWLCPLCGGTHAGVALLTGDLGGAWQANPLMLVVVGLVAVRALGWVVEFVRDPAAASSPRWVPWSVARHWAWYAAAVSVVYVVWRNLG